MRDQKKKKSKYSNVNRENPIVFNIYLSSDTTRSE